MILLSQIPKISKKWLSVALSLLILGICSPASGLYLPTASDNTVVTNEDTALIFQDTDFNFSDVDAGDVLVQVQITSLASAGSLQLSSAAVSVDQVIPAAQLGNLTFVPAPDANGSGYDSFQFKVHDGTDYSDDAYTMTVDVTAVNDAPVVGEIPDQSIAEGLTFATINLDDYVGDLDNTDAEIIWTASGTTELTVSIVDRVAAITMPDADWNGSETITFRATDPGALFAEDAAGFAVTAVNDAPVVSDIPDQSIAEGFTFTTINLDDYVSDVDNTDAEMTWMASGNTELTVAIVDRVAAITIPDIDWNGSETITFRATDPGALFAENAASFTVTAVNDAPLVSNVPDQSIAEGSTFATINLDDYVSDLDNTDAEIVWTANGNTELSVAIVDRVATITIPDSDWNGSETITFRATDPGALFAEDATIFTVTAVNDAPVVSDILDQSIAEGSTFTTINLDEYVSDVDNTDAEMAWTASGNSDLTVAIIGRVATITIPDADWNGTEDITFRATDPELLFAETAAVTFTVTAVNDAPVVSDIPDQSIAEESTFATINLDDYVSDLDNTDAGMVWTVNGNTELTVAIVDRIATITIPDIDWNGSETITFRATDSGALFAEDAANFMVIAVNDEPVVGDIPDQSIAEGSTFATINLDDYVSDIDNTDAEIIWTATGTTELMVTIVGRVATITMPDADWNGSETITFRATDPGALFAEDATIFTVTAVNDAPVVSDIPNQSIAEGSTFTTINLDDYVSDLDNTNAEVAWTASGATELTVDIVDRIATITIPDIDWNGSETITFRATDPGALFAENAASLTVTAVNDAPVIASAAPTTATEDELYSYQVTVVDPDDANNGTDLTFNLINAPVGMTISSTGLIEWTPLEGVASSGEVTLTVADGGEDGAAAGSENFTLTVAAVNDAPVAVDDGYSTDEDVVLSVAAPGVLGNDSDADSDALTAVLADGPTNGTLVLNSDGSFIYTHDGSPQIIDSFTYTAKDASLASTAATVTIRVNPQITLAWNKNLESDLAGYRLYYKIGSPVDDKTDPDVTVIDIPKESLADENNPTYTVKGLDATEIYFFVVTAYDDEDPANESDFSNGESTLRITEPDEGFFVNQQNYQSFETDGKGIPGTSVEVFANDILMGENNDDVKDDGGWNNYLDFTGVSQGEIELTVAYNGISSFPVKGVYDIIAPVIELLDPVPAVTDKKDSYAIIQWTTDEPAFGAVQYGFDENYGDIETSSVLTTNHRVIISGLAAGTEYHFRLSAEDAAGNGPDSNPEDNNPSSDYIFTTDHSTPPSIVEYPFLGPDFITITFNKPDLANAGLETSYSFDPALLFNTSEDESDDILAIDDFTYRLFMRTIAQYEIVTLTVSNIVDSVGQSVSEPTITINDNDQDNMADDWEALYGLDVGNDDSSQDPDGDGLSNYQEYLARTHPRNDAPVAAADALLVVEGGTVSALVSGQSSVLANDTDAEADALTAILVDDVLNGSLTLNSDGTFSYTHDGSETTSDSFTYEAQDTEPRAGDPVTVNITVTAVNDAPVATDAGFAVAENTASGTIVGTVAAFDSENDLLTYTIRSINEMPLISIDNVTVAEGDAGSFNAVFTVTLSAAVSREVTVEYATTDGTAAAGNDYEPLGGTLTFDAGIGTKTLEVLVYGDVTDETYETFFVNLTNAVNAVIADPQGRAIISDDDGSAGPPAGGLVAAYSFDEGSGTIVTDSSGSGNTGVISGAGWSDDAKFGKALAFDGIDDWVTIDDAAALDLSASMTLEAWVYPTEALSQRNWATVIIKEAVYFLYANTSIDTPSTGISLNGNQELYGTQTLPSNIWAHLAGTYDGEQLRLFIDGVEVASMTQTGDFETSDNPLRIGGNSVWNDEFFPGLIDEIRIYDRALSATEIQADMSTPVGPLSQDVPLMVIEDVALEEKDILSDAAIFAVTLSAISQQEVTVSYSTMDGSASAGSDYLPVSGTLKFAPGTTTQLISVAVNGDAISEKDETFFLQLTGATNAEIGDATARALIIDNDESSIFAIDSSTGDIYIADSSDLDYETDASYQLTVEVSDNGTPPLTETVMITVDITDVNDPPVVFDDIYIVNEDNPLGVAAFGVLANDSDADGDSISAVLDTAATNGSLTLNADGSFDYIPDAHFSGTDSFTYHARDATVDSNTATVTITVNSVNDAPVVSDILDQNIAEGSTFATINLDDFVSDIDNTDAEIIWTATGNTELTVAIVNRVATIMIPDMDWNGSETITFRATDSGALFAEDATNFTVTAVNDAPVIISTAPATATEDALYIYQVTVDDPDDANNGADLTFGLTNAPDGMTISDTGLIEWTPLEGVASSGEVTVWVADGGEDGATAVSEKFTLSVTAVNDPPTDITLSNNTITENKPPGTLVGNFSIADADAGDSHTYSLVLTGAGDLDWLFFTIAGSELRAGVTLDYEAKSFYNLLVIAEDQSGETFEKPFTIVVNNVNNEPPLGITMTNSAIPENQPIGTTVGTFLTTDQDIGQIHLYSFADGVNDDDNALFTIFNDELRTGASFDFETKSTYKIRVRTDDQHGGAFEEKLTITVIDVNDAPVASDDTVSTSEGIPMIIEVLANDSDEDGDGLTVTGVTQGPDANGTVVVNGDNTVTYTPDAFFNGQDTFSYDISDGQGGSDAAVVNVNVYAALFTFSWEALESPEVAGYFVHVGTAPRDYTRTIDVGNVTICDVWLAEKLVTYYFSVTAYDSDGQEIDFFKPEISAHVRDDNHIETATNYEDAWNQTVSGWTVYDNDPAGAEISNAYDTDRQSRVIELAGSGTSNSYRLRNDDGSPWLNSSQFIVEWSMRYSENFYVYLDVETTAGHRYIYYTPDDYDLLGNAGMVHHGLGSDVIDGQWHTFVRDLQGDLEHAQPGVSILEVNGFLIRGSGRVDDIKLLSDMPAFWDTDGDGIADVLERDVYGTDPYTIDSDGDGMGDDDELAFWGNDWSIDYDGDGLNNLVDIDSDNDGASDGSEIVEGSDPGDNSSIPPQTVYEDAKDDSTEGWDIYDADPAGAIISNVFDDDRQSWVIEFAGSGISNGFRLRHNDGSPWLNSSQFIVEWSMRYSENFYVYLDVETTAGHRYIYYTPDDYDLLGSAGMVHHGLGSDVMDGQWRTFVRDLRVDLAEAQPGVSILEVNGFLIRGSGRADDIKLLSDMPASWDTDGDGIADIDERGIYGTDPHIVDTDRDGLNDGDELAFWGNNWDIDYDSDGLNNLVDIDSDNDGASDGSEIVEDSDPGDNSSIPPQTVYEDAEDDSTDGWDIYDSYPVGAQISNVFDEVRQSWVIEFAGSGTANGFRLRHNDGSPWINSSLFVIEWSMQYSENFYVYLDVETTAGHQYIYYTPDDYDLLGNAGMVHHGLGSDVIDGAWRTIVRDLQADLEAAQPGVSIMEVNGFLIRGSGKVDDIKLRGN